MRRLLSRGARPFFGGVLGDVGDPQAVRAVDSEVAVDRQTRPERQLGVNGPEVLQQQLILLSPSRRRP